MCPVVRSQITANARAGQGGGINIVAEAILADPDSVVDVSSQIGIDGEVNIEAVVTNLRSPDNCVGGGGVCSQPDIEAY